MPTSYRYSLLSIVYSITAVSGGEHFSAELVYGDFCKAVGLKIFKIYFTGGTSGWRSRNP